MTHADILFLAKTSAGQFWMDADHIQRFAALIIAIERKECAEVADEVGDRDSNNHAWDAAVAIRARSKA